MDSFMGLAKQGFAAYEASQQGGGQSQSNQSFNKTGGEEYNSPEQHGGGRPQANALQGGPELDSDEVVNHAQEHGEEDSDAISQGLAFVKGKMGSGSLGPQNHHIDEEELQNAHKEVYQNGNASSLPASSLGSAAALQAIKSFTSGGGGSSSSGGGMQSKLMGMAMAEASKLYASQGSGAGGGGKQEMMNSAAETVMKFMLKSQMSSMMGGGNSGGLGGLASLAGKFM